LTRGGYVKVPPGFTPDAMAALLSGLKKWGPAYLQDDPRVGGLLPVVPWSEVQRYYAPEERLREILANPRDALEEMVRRLTLELVSAAGIPQDALGITGSVLAGVHDPETSDIDLLVTGRESTQKLKAAMSTGRIRHVGPVSEPRVASWIRSLILDYPLTIQEAWHFVDRRWNCRSFEGRFFSVFPVRSDEESLRLSVGRAARSLGTARVRAVIAQTDEGLFFLPAVYALERVTVVEGPDVEIREVVSYDGLYVDAFDEGMAVEIRGELEALRGDGARLVVGISPLAGRAYARPLF
jgi:predicted nucleotidyltransferase